MKKYLPEIIITVIVLCIVTSVFGYVLVRNFLPNEIYLPPINLPHIILVTPAPYPTYTFFPTYTTIPPTPGPQWVWRTLTLYNWKVEIPSNWTIAEMDRKPEPTGFLSMGHDCADYQLISPDRMKFVNIIMPCGPSDSTGWLCPDDTTYVKAVDTGYLIRRPYNGNSFLYQIAEPGTYEDTTGTHTGLFCWASPLFLYYYWELGKTADEIYPDIPDVDRIMLSLLTANDNNKFP